MKRKPAVAGSFYPADPKELEDLIKNFLEKAEIKKIPGQPKILIVPHAGYIYSGPVAAFAYKLLEGRQFNKVILLGPSHYYPITQPIASESEIWETPLGEIKTFPPPFEITFDEKAHQPEHSLEVQLPFLQIVLENFSFLPILINNENQSEELAEKIFPLIKEETLVIASSDLSHFYPEKIAQEIDHLANEVIPQLNFEKAKEIEACGLAAVLTGMFLAKKLNCRGQLLKYQTSSATTGDFSNVVGYGTYVFFK